MATVINLNSILTDLRNPETQREYATRWEGNQPLYTNYLTLATDGTVAVESAPRDVGGTPADIYYRTGRIQWRLPAGFNCQALADWLVTPETQARFQAVLDGWTVDYEQGRGKFTPVAEVTIEAVQEELNELPGPCYEWGGTAWWEEFAAEEAPRILAGETTVEDVVAKQFGDADVLEEAGLDPDCVTLLAREDLRQALEERLAAIR